MTEVFSTMLRTGLIGRRSLLLIGAATILVVTLNSAAAATVGSSSTFEGATLYVDSGGLGSSDVTVDLELRPSLRADPTPGVAARIDLMIPAGYRMNLALRPGARVGELLG